MYQNFKQNTLIYIFIEDYILKICPLKIYLQEGLVRFVGTQENIFLLPPPQKKKNFYLVFYILWSIICST